jgi:hypothetical protein
MKAGNRARRDPVVCALFNSWATGSLLALFPAFIFVMDPVGWHLSKLMFTLTTLDGTDVDACSSSFHGHDEDDYGG